MNETIKRLALGQEIVDATREVFSAMLMMDIAGEDVSANNRELIRSNMTSMIGLGGGVRGMLAVHCPEAVARAITGTLLGMEIEKLDEDVKDAIGEVANMVAGHLKIAYGACGIPVELAIPTSIIGESFRLSGMAGATRHYVAFHLDSGPFWVELAYVLS